MGADMGTRENQSPDPSCSADDGVTELQENVLELLEDAGIPQDVCDRMMACLWNYETASAIEARSDAAPQSDAAEGESAVPKADAPTPTVSQ